MASRLESNLEAIKALIDFKKGVKQDTNNLNYTGFGGLAEILFDPYKADIPDPKFGGKANREIIKQIYERCKDLDNLYNLHKGAFLSSCKRSTSTAYYTPSELVSSIINYISDQNFKPDKFLDPSAGGGIFGRIAKNIFSSEVIQIEKDLITAEILKYSNSDCTTYCKSYEDFKPNQQFDLISTNIPFGSIGVMDIGFFNGTEVQRFSTQRIHNYFLMKSFDLLREGGLIAFIMPIGVMDSPSNIKIREELLSKGDLINLIRLPNNIFHKTNTEVVTDLFIYQKNLNKTKLSEADQILIHKTGTLSKAEKIVKYNGYFDLYPEKMIGDPFIKGLYGDDFDLKPDRSNEDILKAISSILEKSPIPIFGKLETQNIKSISIITPKKAKEATKALQLSLFDNIINDSKQLSLEVKKKHKEIPVLLNGNEIFLIYPGALFIINENIGNIQFDNNNEPFLVPIQTDKNDYLLFKSFIQFKNTYRLLVNAQSNELSGLEEIRAELNKHYDSFVSKFGFIGENIKQLENVEPLINTYKGIEIETEEGVYIKGDIFFQNTYSKSIIEKEEEISYKANSLYDILIYTLNEYGNVHMGKICEISKLQEDECFEQLKEYIFKTPSGYEMRDAYLSGDIIKKIEEIEGIVLKDKELGGESEFERNLIALNTVKPQPIRFEDITITMGQRWIPNYIYKAYLTSIFGQELSILYRETSDAFSIQKPYAGNKKIHGYSISDILEATMNSKMLKYYDTFEDPEGKTIRKLNPFYTKELQALQKKYNDEFNEFLNKKQGFKTELQAIYNYKFNRIVKRKYDGSFLKLNDLQYYEPFPYQKDTVYMGTQNNGGYFDHCVGAGKTLTMIMCSYELKRLKIANKPCILAIKSTLGDIANEYRRAYPKAKILVADDRNFEKTRREHFFSQIVNENWDCIIMSHDNFGRIPHDKNLQMQVIQEELDRLEADLDVYRGEKDISKRMLRGLEFRKERLENELKELKLKKDDTFTFQNMGIDHLFIDEAHMFKNLRFTTRLENVKGLGNTAGAIKTTNLLIAIRSIQNKYGADKGITFLSGTPISNSISEMYSISKYLTPKLLEQMGLISFDAWQRQFAQVTNDYEMTVTGDIKPTQRLAVFVNLPELIMLYSNIADVRVEKDIVTNIKNRPKASTNFVNIPPLEEQMKFSAGVQLAVEHLDWSYLQIGINRKFDEGEEKAKMLLAAKYIDEMSLDMKLINPVLFANYTSPKLLNCAEKVYLHYYETNVDKGTQLIFCDKGTPKENDHYSVYSELKKLLVQKGIPKHEIAFIHDAKTDKQRKELFIKVNAGEIRVMIGSTGKMGTGVNVQKRVVALHHLDALWRPSDFRQRVGRGERQGNELGMKYGLKNYVYATEKTLDAYKFNILDGKEKFIEQIKKNEIGGRTASQDLLEDEDNMSFSKYVAILSGDNRLLSKAKLEREIDMLFFEKKEIDKLNNQNAIILEEKIEKVKSNKDALQRLTPDYNLLTTLPRDEEGKLIIFFHTDDGRVLKKATEIGEHLKSFVQKQKNVGGFEEKKIYDTSCTVGKYKIKASLIEKSEKDEKGLFSSTTDIKFYIQGASSQLYSTEGRSFASCEASQLGQFIRDALQRIESTFTLNNNELKKAENIVVELRNTPKLEFLKDEKLAFLKIDLEKLIDDLTKNPIKNPLEKYKKDILESVNAKIEDQSICQKFEILDEDELVKGAKNILKR